MSYNKLFRHCFFGTAFFLSFMANVSGQTVINRSASITIPSLALVDIEPNSNTINLSYSNPSEAGSPMDVSGAVDNTKWLNYSSSNAISVTRAITVQISSGTIGSGLNLNLVASAYSGSGNGVSFATSAGSKVLSGTPQIILTGLSSCFTGNGSGNGHLLTFSLTVSNYGNIKFANSSALVITYTMVDL